MRRDKQIAFKLRLDGKSYSEIRSALGVPKSTLSLWFSEIVLSEESRSKIAARAKKKSLEGLLRHNHNQTKNAFIKARGIRKAASIEIEKLSLSELKMIGIALYWAEGYKRAIVRKGKTRTYHPVSLTNSDPHLVKVFLRFLRECCGVLEEKIKAGLRIFPHQNELELLHFWHDVTKIKLENFNKTYHGISKASNGKRPFNRLQYGVIQIVVADTVLFHKIMGYIEGIQKIV